MLIYYAHRSIRPVANILSCMNGVNALYIHTVKESVFHFAVIALVQLCYLNRFLHIQDNFFSATDIWFEKLWLYFKS